ncbi:HlyD family efflux transporter periplasmic adaptor subunit [Nostoc sp. FACHB-152]|uniref:HlyD family secretion protein n=1 Tax=unclassified Nostoc TaxID=2593658 RepID=UPI001684540E|nr:MULTISPECIES: HlyD family efflux transporter periplasmic adaptor subunit [unclassified Nostoc]MBD2451038.1 HlyD family efflux transporter periplasmic adaptor subunit [Nostoc sp. FACHB-152]MBD2471076.1 HlyD family efflux transporter periplasmic adaptor subunit [Nostoc sp. FACHB-145]
MFIDPQPDFLRIVENDEYLPPIGIWTRLGGIFLVGTVCTAFGFSSVIKYNVTVDANATVRPTGEIRLVQAAAEGTVTSIKVKENQVVKKGDEIALIEKSELQSKKSQIIGNIRQNQLQRSQINAQLKALEAQIAAESNATQRAIMSAQAELSGSERDYRDKQITTQAEVAEVEASVELAKEELKRYQQLADTGAIATLQIKEKEQAFKAAQARLERTKAALNPLNSTVEIAQQRIAQERAKGESTLATLNREKQQLISRQVEIQNQISNAQEELKQTFTQLQRTVIRSSETGTILKLELRNTGQLVRIGDAIAQIAPSAAPLVIKGRVAAADISKVQICKAAKVSECTEGKVVMRLSAYPYPDYGILKGAVRAISADAITPQNNGSIQTLPYYEVTIQPEKLNLTKNGKPYPIQAGMEVTAEIISKEETLLTFILRKARLLTDV